MRRLLIALVLLLGCESLISSHDGPCDEKYNARDIAQRATERATSAYDGACRAHRGQACDKLPEHAALQTALRAQSEAQAVATKCQQTIGTLSAESPITP